MYSVYKDGVEVYNTSSSSSAAAASCVVGDKLTCGLAFDDDDKRLTVYFNKNNQKVLFTCLPTSGCRVPIFCGILTPTPGFKKIGSPTPALKNPQTPTPG